MRSSDAHQRGGGPRAVLRRGDGEDHLLRAFAKLGVDDRTAAVAVALERGLLLDPRNRS